MRQRTGRFYRLTSEGRALWSRRERVALPAHYVRIFGLLEFSGHSEVVRSHLAHHPEHVVEAWFRELEAHALIEATTVDAPDISGLAAKAPPLEDEEKQRISEDAKFANISLSRLGAYVDHDRVVNRPRSWKAPKYTSALVIEDDPDQLALAVLRLTNAGYHVHTGDSVKALMNSLRKGTPDALFLDVMLPDGDGFDVLATLRQHPSYALLPIIMVTAKTEASDIAKGLALGADAYVTKPYGRNTLDYVLRYVLQQELPAPEEAAPAAAPAPEKKSPPAEDVLKTRDDVRALLAELAIQREAQEARAAARWRAVKHMALAIALAIAALQYYMMDTVNQIVSLQQMPVFVPVPARDQRSALEAGVARS